jgi:hypothetical protein
MFFTPELLTRRDSGFGLLWYVDRRSILLPLEQVPPGWLLPWALNQFSENCPKDRYLLQISLNYVT